MGRSRPIRVFFHEDLLFTTVKTPPVVWPERLESEQDGISQRGSGHAQQPAHGKAHPSQAGNLVEGGEQQLVAVRSQQHRAIVHVQ